MPKRVVLLLPIDYARAHTGEGMRWRLTGGPGDLEIDVPPAPVQGYLARLDDVLGAETAHAVDR